MNEAYIEAFKQAIQRDKRFRCARSVKSIIRGRWLGSSIKKVNAKTFWGDEMNVVLPECVSSAIYDAGFFEEGLTFIVLKYVKPGTVFVDIGAHFGYFSSLASKLVGKRGQVHSFEPTPSTFRILEKNLHKRGNVFLNNLALWSEDKVITLNDYGLKYCAFNSLFDPKLDKKTLKHISVKKHKIIATSVDKYVFDNGLVPNFIKIDAESAEYEIIAGMKKTIDKYHPIISLEVGDDNIKQAKTCREVVLVLKDRGYDVFEYKSGKILPHKIKKSYQYDNLLFLPSD
jgi:FkbM family methyltransferase